MQKLMILNGPNLNLLGSREPEQYGSYTLEDVEQRCISAAAAEGYLTDFRQSNHEGVLVDAIHEAGEQLKNGELAGIIFNPAAYTHTSVALHDAIKGTQVPVIEVHISNVHAREEFRHHSYISPAALGIVVGFGVYGYELAIRGLTEKLRNG